MAPSIECEWQSIMPGMTYLPVASITFASAAAFRFLPTAAIFPRRRRTSVFCIVPCVMVNTVALRISVSAGSGLFDFCAPLRCKQTMETAQAKTINSDNFFIFQTPNFVGQYLGLAVQ